MTSPRPAATATGPAAGPPAGAAPVGEPVPRPDLDGLHAAAARLRAQAEVTRGLARTVVAAAAATGWRSTAATACRRRLAEHAQALLGAATLLEYAAEAVADHARTAAARAEALAQTTAAAASLAAGTVSVGVEVAARGVATAAEGVTAAPGEVVSTVTGWAR